MDRSEPLISIKIQRVVPLEPESQKFLTPGELQSLLFNGDGTINNGNPADESTGDNCDNLPSNFSNDWVLLPKTFSQIYLGEVFSFYLKSCSLSQDEVLTDVKIRIDMQLASNRVVNIAEIKRTKLEPLEALHHILHHEVKEMGSNVLICTVAYKKESDADELQSFRKFFKFHVDKPLDVKTKFYNAESDEVYLETLLQNLTSLPISLDSVSLEPSVHFEVNAINKRIHGDGSEEWVFGSPNRFNPNDYRQYLFCLSPKPEVKCNKNLLKSVTVIGKLDIRWTSGIGCKGHLQTSQLERMPPNYSDLRLCLEMLPGIVKVNRPFEVKFRVTNCCHQNPSSTHNHINQHYQSSSGDAAGIKWVGTSGRSLGSVRPQESKEIKLTAIPLKTGLYPIPSLKMSDLFLRNDYSFEEIAFVYVKPDSKHSNPNDQKVNPSLIPLSSLPLPDVSPT